MAQSTILLLPVSRYRIFKPFISIDAVFNAYTIEHHIAPYFSVCWEGKLSWHTISIYDCEATQIYQLIQIDRKKYGQYLQSFPSHKKVAVIIVSFSRMEPYCSCNSRLNNWLIDVHYGRIFEKRSYERIKKLPSFITQSLLAFLLHIEDRESYTLLYQML